MNGGRRKKTSVPFLRKLSFSPAVSPLQSIARLTAALFRDRPNSLALTSAAVSAGTIKFICDMLLLPPQTAGTPGQAAAAVPELGAGGLAALEAFAAVACSGAAAVSGSSTRGALDWAVTRGIVERISTVACDHCCGDDALSGSSAKVEVRTRARTCGFALG